MCTIVNLSAILNELDSEVITYNGSLLPIKGGNGNDLYICAYRATTKPYLDKSAPPYPYSNINFKWWFNKNNYIGLVIIKTNSGGDMLNIESLEYCRYIHNIDSNMSNIKYIEYLKKINNDQGSDFSNLLSGPEDPRLYYKEGKVCMNYNSVLVYPKAGCQNECVGMFEIPIDIDILKKISSSSKKYYPDLKKKLICSKVNGKPLFKGKKMKELTLKNWSYAPGYFIDSYNDKSFLYTIYKNSESCKKTPYIHTLKPFVQFNWSIALTTPTVEKGGFLYGVAHIRVPWKELVLNDEISSNIKKIIYKGDVHNNDFYFMSIYKIDNNTQWSLTKPVLITGLTDLNYYSYNVNFPCGFFIEKEKFNVTFGLGDCLLFSYIGKLDSLVFEIKQFNYRDLTLIEVDNLMLKKEYVNSALCNNSKLNNYLYPKNIRLFDLGGGGLRTLVYNFKDDKYSDITILGQSKILNLPSEIIRQTINIQDELMSGMGFAFSLASLEKLWVISIQTEAMKLFKNKSIHDTFDLNTQKKTSIKDSISLIWVNVSI